MSPRLLAVAVAAGVRLEPLVALPLPWSAAMVVTAPNLTSLELPHITLAAAAVEFVPLLAVVRLMVLVAWAVAVTLRVQPRNRPETPRQTLVVGAVGHAAVRRAAVVPVDQASSLFVGRVRFQVQSEILSHWSF